MKKEARASNRNEFRGRGGRLRRVPTPHRRRYLHNMTTTTTLPRADAVPKTGGLSRLCECLIWGFRSVLPPLPLEYGRGVVAVLGHIPEQDNCNVHPPKTSRLLEHFSIVGFRAEYGVSKSSSPFVFRSVTLVRSRRATREMNVKHWENLFSHILTRHPIPDLR